MKLTTLKLNIPLNFNFLLIKNLNNNTNIIIYNNEFKLNLNFKVLTNLKLNKHLNNIKYKNLNLKKNFYNIENNFFHFLNKLNNYYFIKIKFKGKGYKIGFYKRKIINFYFGKSHKSIFIYKNTKLKKINKYKFILLKNNFNSLKLTGLKTQKIKNINHYTNRGLRFSRQLIIRRKGKKGSFI